MDLRHFRYFAAVAQDLNFSEASRRLHVAQPAISQTILDLEEELEVKLFFRTNRSVELTPVGKVFLKGIEDILIRTEEAKRLAQRASRGELGTLKIGFIEPAVSTFLPSVVQAYRRQYPDVEVQLHHMNPDLQLVAFDEGRIDFGLSRPLPHERLATFSEEVIYNDYLAAVLPPNHPLAKKKCIKLEDLAEEPFVLFKRDASPCVFDEAIAACQRVGFSPKLIYEAALMITVFTIVESGLGVGLVPGCVSGLEHKKTLLRHLASRSEAIPVCAAWRRVSNNPTVPTFLKVLRSHKSAIQRQMRDCAHGIGRKNGEVSNC